MSADGAYQVCRQKFADHPLAVRPLRLDGQLIREMILIQRREDEVDFSVLQQHGDGPAAIYSLSPWPDGDAVTISHDESISSGVAEVVADGVPLPRHGSLFGWSNGEAFTTLIPAYTDPTVTSSLPSWSVMPLAGSRETEWPPFVNEPYLGGWFWDYLRAGRLVSLATFVAETPDTIFWADTKSILGSDTCVVARDVVKTEGPALRRGAYVYARALRARLSVPPLADLLAAPATVDIAEFFALPNDLDSGESGSYGEGSGLRANG